MKCKECKQVAKWLIIDQLPYDELFLPLCEEHFQQLREMEGEMNLDFEYIENLDIEEVMVKANEKWLYLTQKYKNTLNLYSQSKRKKDVVS